ncbi:CRISPR-associated protein Cas4 [Tetragenococcus koreensis]|uniref:CRISPR-associated exonuclease Cas4 n=1 Tax=Tetragenococcus koreensis TaxID=290335 RepID=A0AAN4UBC8_9ENTE|nr:CRISPR-associated protein Cas4 [Tetragenococcus koreensis]MCF1585640.1 CRISPR-associated protein Cas4 [Tetragenococcus koreensis]MCF1615248.1 CRISPR-associated protein Cas4 [Tetragenococcus koreensis]MCF1617509.1 CRISPR-associated protein Cas4 [Tetragenococcus koreensis]MCF1620283.1 CRISPR-associated protein Cas4 [Tetragenococcus koreensis]MCF1622268.1 CRISPR-associated protein Cas4 [Tetragenococcus koreensis]
MSYVEDEYLMLSGIQHYYFCKRQWGLIHIDQQWAENSYTAEGQQLHKKADDPYIKEKRKDMFISRAIHVSSSSLGLSGILDVVEFYKDKKGISFQGKKGKWQPYIVEYKRGQPKKDKRDVIQLVAEVMCLEETLDCQISNSYLFYHSVNKKIKIDITKELRDLVHDFSAKMHFYYQHKKVPDAEFFKNCRLCSLYDICMPRMNKRPKNIDNYIENAIYSEADVCENY